MTNPIKRRLQRELDQAIARRDDGPSFSVPGFRQRSGGLNVARDAQEWAVTWRRRLLADLPDSVAEMERRDRWLAGTRFQFLVFKDADGTEIAAVIPRHCNSIYRYAKLEGETLDQMLGLDKRRRTPEPEPADVADEEEDAPAPRGP